MRRDRIIKRNTPWRNALPSPAPGAWEQCVAPSAHDRNYALYAVIVGELERIARYRNRNVFKNIYIHFNIESKFFIRILGIQFKKEVMI